MLFTLLSILDLIAGGFIVAGHFHLVHVPLLYVGVYLASKVFFWRDLFSFIDLFAALYCIFVFFGHTNVFTWIFFVYFLYKFSVWAYTAASS